MDKKKLWLIIGSALTLVILVFGVLIYNNYFQSRRIAKDKENISAVTNDFTLAWHNYTDQTSSSYLAQIKPFMTYEFYSATEYINTQRPQDFENQLPMTAKILSTTIQKYETDVSTVNVTLETTEVGSPKKDTNITVTLGKHNGSWLVSSFE